MPLDFNFTDEQELFRKVVRELCDKEIRPHVRKWDEKGEFSWTMFRKLADAGVTGLMYPEEYGGLEGDAVTMGVAVEEIGRAGGPYPLWSWGELISRYGSEEQKKKYLPPIVKGESFLGVASTEPGGGSDAAGIKTRAKREGDHYIVNGEKQCISHINEASAHMVTAKTAPERGAKGISMLIVEGDRPGLSKYLFKTFGWRAESLGGFALNDVKVPASNLVGKEGEGFIYLMQSFDFVRALIGLWCVGMAEASLEESMEYVRQRKAFGQPIGKFESVQFRIVEDYTKVEAARLLCYRALWTKDQGKQCIKESAMAKWYAPVVAYEAVDDCLQNHGALGFTTESLDEYRLREIRGALIGDGTPDIMKIIIGRELLGREYVPYK